ncbi:MAG: hypothetical protein CMQ40_05935 [Gammaproteobacteria bacterium]|nr:hypothetical protein [Gammaproteobacteria bacterium]|tara:strand:- start:164 stop:391 length:228 start_codon:yes stop_codon:yes gene_type:complete
MLLKLLVVLLFLANLFALGIALVALMRDQDREEGTRTAKFLLVRVSLALALLIVVAYGFYTGQLGVTAPWYGISS